MKKKLIIIFQLISINIFCQDTISFKEPLNIIAIEKVPTVVSRLNIMQSDNLIINGITYCTNELSTSPVVTILAKNSEGKESNFEYKRLGSFIFQDINNINKQWDKKMLQLGTFSNLVMKGYQYDLREELNSEASDYINTLSNNYKFFDDEYLEDYMYTLINKIHNGIQNDKRPGNIYLKIVRDNQPNAFALPNGCLVVSTGLLSTIQSEDELIGILAHEVAHFALDHSILNYNKEKERRKRAEFWAIFASVVAAGADVLMSVNDNNHTAGILTASTAILASVFTDEIVNRLSIKYSQAQEIEADFAAKEVLEILNYDKLGLSIALSRIKNYCIKTGNYLALSGSGTHPSLDKRIMNMGTPINIDKYSQPSFLKKVSFINSYNAWIELWYFAHHQAALDLVHRNILNNVATETDFIIKAVVNRRTSNTIQSNESVLFDLTKAKSLNVIPNFMIFKEEGITYIRLEKKLEAKKSFQTYLTSLMELREKNDIKEIKNRNKGLEEEINWTKKMIFKVDNL